MNNNANAGIPSQDKLPLKDLLTFINSATTNVAELLGQMRNDPDNVDISKMFGMQMAMNKLTQISEMATSVASASNQSLGSMARNIK